MCLAQMCAYLHMRGLLASVKPENHFRQYVTIRLEKGLKANLTSSARLQCIYQMLEFMLGKQLCGNEAIVPLFCMCMCESVCEFYLNLRLCASSSLLLLLAQTQWYYSRVSIDPVQPRKW